MVKRIAKALEGTQDFLESVTPKLVADGAGWLTVDEQAEWWRLRAAIDAVHKANRELEERYEQDRIAGLEALKAAAKALDEFHEAHKGKYLLYPDKLSGRSGYGWSY